ncbi:MULTISPECIES: nicotinate-nucleotide--dimethylbenzimidazole phosphoribosyltransferase [unclassified Ochrobactrum]|uniref:nicotinate-nucleotide--dimethylbenzimidazole phosphoribosyltransferase n=1 Tax=unclassified Ochrobactrum TaxID=239106 RepID=UPI0030B1B8C4
MSASGLPFDDFRELIRNLPGPDLGAEAAVRAREATLTKPAGSLGQLEEIVAWLAAWTGKSIPQINRPLVAVFAGNHGVTEKNITPFPSSVTAQMVENFAAGGAAINQLCIAHDLGLKVFDLALEHPTGDITEEAAMDERTCAATMAFGMEGIAGGTDLLCIGEMGIGNTTIAAAIAMGLFGGSAEDWVGPGTGSTGELLHRKLAAVRAAVNLHQDHLRDPLEVLRRLGGRELAAMAGAILAARMEKIPVIVDGFVASAAAAVLYAANPTSLDHCLFGHVSAEPGHRLLLEKMGKKPLLDLGMRLGEGTGAALAAGIVKAAALCHSGMATFEQAGVTSTVK